MGGVFASRWWIVFASACGLLVRTGSILVFSFGVFPEPVTEDPGISRGDVPTALGGATWRLMDRWGTRRILIPGVLAFALAVAGFGLMQEEPRYLVFLIFGTVGLVVSKRPPLTPPWCRDGSTAIAVFREAWRRPVSVSASRRFCNSLPF
jgi:hypothetical protein